jgi:hypothetical protein
MNGRFGRNKKGGTEMKTARATSAKTKDVNVVPTVWRLLREADDEHMEPKQAVKYVRKHAAQASLDRFLDCEIERTYKTLQRRDAVNVEEEASAAVFQLAHPGSANPATFHDRVARLAYLAKNTFQTHDGKTIIYGQATATQHRDRAAWLNQHADSERSRAKDHLDLADALEASGCRNLNELLKKEGGRR